VEKPRFTSPKANFKKQLNHKEKRPTRGVQRSVQASRSHGHSTRRYDTQSEGSSHQSTSYNTDPFLSVTGKATTGEMAAATRTNATGSLL
jgi:hypothetical protein